jgi:hypothetical protein
MPNIIKVPKERVTDDWDLPYGGGPDVLVVDDEIVSTGRWSIHHLLTIKMNDKYYQTEYSVGATESQDERPWQYKDVVEFTEVQKVTKTVEVFEPVP